MRYAIATAAAIAKGDLSIGGALAGTYCGEQ
jgi:hypothetical protein